MKLLLLATFPLLALAPTRAAAAGSGHGHDHGDEPTAAAAVSTSQIRLTRAIVQNLDLQTAEVETQALEKTFPALGHLEADYARVSAVTSRVPGRVARLDVHEGERVQAGQVLLEVESRVAADPPPRITFKAPRDGVVLDLHTLAGEAVEPDTHLLKIADLGEVFAVAQVFEGQLGFVRPGQKARVRPIAFANEVFEGEVVRTAAQLDAATGTLRVFVRVANPDGRLLPGMRVQLAFVTAESDTAVVVPREAVLGEWGDLFVFRQIMTAPFAYERTPVVVGLRDDRFIEIIDGVLPGDRVVTRGNYQLQYLGSGAPTIEDDHGHSHGPGGHQH